MQFIKNKLFTIFDIKRYFIKKKKNGGKPAKEKIKKTIKYSKKKIFDIFNSEIHFIEDKSKLKI